MKKILILVAMFLVCGFVNGQCFIYSTNSTSSGAVQTVIGKIKGGEGRCAMAAALLLLL